MTKKTGLAVLLLIAFITSTVLVYIRFIGFERPPLAHRFPENTWAYLSVRHFNKAFLAFLTEDDLAAAAQVATAASYLLGFEPPAETDEEPAVDPKLWDALGSFVRTQVAVAALSPPRPDQAWPDIALVAYRYGDPLKFKETAEEIARQASIGDASYRWIQKDFGGEAYQTLVTTEDLPPISWTSVDDVLIIASTPAAIERMLAHHLAQPARTLAERLAPHRIDSFIEQTDITFYLDGPQSLEFAEDELASKLRQLGGFYSSFSPARFSQEIGLKQLDSLVVSQKLKGNQESYSSLLYTGKPRLFECLSDGDHSLHPRYEAFPISLSDSIRIDMGQLAEVVRDATFKAAPLTTFAYLGAQGQVLSDTGESLNAILSGAFAGHLATLATFDTSTYQAANGISRQDIVFDGSAKFALGSEGPALKAVIEYYLAQQLPDDTAQVRFENGIFYIDGVFGNGQIVALEATPETLTLGLGTLKSFDALRSRQELYLANEDTLLEGVEKIASGQLALEGMPDTLYAFAKISYERMYPGLALPEEFLEFDWTTLSALDQVRESQVLSNPAAGHLYRLSKKRR